MTSIEAEYGSEAYLRSFSGEALEAMDNIAETARQKASGRTGSTTSPLANTQTFTGTDAINHLSRSEQTLKDGYRHLQREPAIARLIYEDEQGAQHTLYIARSMTVTGIPGITLACDKAPLGRLAELDVGDAEWISIGGQEQELTLLEVAILRPSKDDQGWDSSDTIYKHEATGVKTISSLRRLLGATQLTDDDFEAWLSEDEQDDNIIQGIAHQIRTAMGLRDQPILDKFQGEIFRLPLNSQLFIVGPPGTGKTTTLIKRLGQKLDEEYLTPTEKNLILKSPAPTAHSQSWLMFTPTELLKHYVKEAFAREDVAASDEHIRTWDKTRRDLARNVLGLLQSGSNKGKFILKSEESYLKPEHAYSPQDWFTAFADFYKEQSIADIRTAFEQACSALGAEGNEFTTLTSILDEQNTLTLSSLFRTIEEVDHLITPRIETSDAEADKLARRTVNALFKQDKTIFQRLAKFLDELAIDNSVDEDDELEDVDSEQEEAAQGKELTPQEAARILIRQFKSAGRARYLARSISKTSKNGKVLTFLSELCPTTDQLKAIGQYTLIASSLRRVANAHRRYITDIPARYKRFRRQDSGYYLKTIKGQDISSTELDAVILLTLLNSRELLAIPFIDRQQEQPKFSYLARISSQFKNQILVDEATDFSLLQLACMQSLTHVATHSFFACGDFNQRLTQEGVRNREQLNWLPLKFEFKPISTVYRQSQKLNELSKALLTSFGGDESSAGMLPEELVHPGVQPVLAEWVTSIADIATWLAARIEEIEASVQQLPTIGVLVDSESDVEPLAKQLSEALEDLNIEAEACLGGKSLGEKTGVRIFSAEYIKGLEFEAVFFINIDQLAEQQPELFDKYLYVGVTRAATYLGITCTTEFPTQLQGLKEQFTDRWSN